MKLCITCCHTLPAEEFAEQAEQVKQQLREAYLEQAPFNQVISELQQLATYTRVPGTSTRAPMVLRPSIAVTVDLKPLGKGKPPRDGTVALTVRRPDGCQSKKRKLLALDCMNLADTLMQLLSPLTAL
jgi:hypothetical protein